MASFVALQRAQTSVGLCARSLSRFRQQRQATILSQSRSSLAISTARVVGQRQQVVFVPVVVL
jgi:hypothetical protein